MASPDQYDLSGKGVCIILANFIGEKTGCMEGYTRDVENLEEFFSKQDFTILKQCNQTGSQFRKYLESVTEKWMNGWKSKTNEEKNNYTKENIARLFVFVLSHGDKNGIKMCVSVANNMYQETDTKDMHVTISADEIMNHFTHDKWPFLKSIPKCFFFQACRGEDVPQMASFYDNPKPSTLSLPDNSMGSHRLPIAADVFHAYSTLEDGVAFVKKSSGSFISTLVDAMTHMHKRHDICSIMTTVISKALEKEHRRFYPCNSSDNEIAVLDDGGELCPIAVYGYEKNKESSTARKLHVKTVNGHRCYSGFIKKGQVEIEEELHTLKGQVYFRQEEKVLELIPFDKLTFKKLVPFKDTEHFLIKGILYNKGDEPVAEGQVTVGETGLVIEGEIEPLANLTISDLQLIISKDDKFFQVSEIAKKQGYLFINGVYYGSGMIEKENEDNQVYGIRIGVYQLPTFTSTLTKTLYIKEVEDQEVSLRTHCYKISQTNGID